MRHRDEDCKGETVAGKPFGHMPWSPRPATYSPPHKPAEARGEKPQEIHHRTTEEVARAPELERRLCRRRRDQADLRPVASGKAQPQETPLDVASSREPACTPRRLSRRTFRRRYGKVAEALCPYTPCGSLRPKLYPPCYDLQLCGWVGG